LLRGTCIDRTNASATDDIGTKGGRGRHIRQLRATRNPQVAATIRIVRNSILVVALEPSAI
jgi:hypothetical protein